MLDIVGDVHEVVVLFGVGVSAKWRGNGFIGRGV
jgi:hypothetical protein